MPAIDRLVVVPIDFEHMSQLTAFGFKFEGDLGQGNLLFIDPEQRPLDLSLRLRGCSNVSIVLGLGHPVSGRLAFNGSGGLFLSGGFGVMGGTSTFRITMGEGAAVFFGRDCTSVRSEWLIEGKGHSLIVGDDLMCSWDVTVRNYDSHAIIDTITGQVINQPGDTIIGPHCWLGLGSSILRGVKIGRGSIVGMRAAVVSEVEDCCAVAGIPARRVRENVTWTRSPKPSAITIRSTIKSWCS